MVLANQQTEAIAKARLAVLVAVISVRGNLVLNGRCRGARSRSPAKFLYRAEAQAIGLAECTVDGAGFSDAHLGAVD
jgi:hypothetical protein